MKQKVIISDTHKDNISYFEREPAFLVSMTKGDFPYLKEQEFSNYPAVYVLIGGNKRYVGQAAGQSISTRLSQHFTNEKKYRVDSVLFFSRTDGKLSKADIDYLEKRVIQDFIEKSDYEMMNHTSGNDSFIDKLQKAKSDQLYDTAFEIIDEIVNIDLFGSSEDNKVSTVDVSTDVQYQIEYDGKRLASKSARGLLVDFVSQLFTDEKYTDQLHELIVDETPSFAMILGRKPSMYNGRPNSAKVADGVWVYANFNKKNVRIKIEKLARQLGIPVIIKWN